MSAHTYFYFSFCFFLEKFLKAENFGAFGSIFWLEIVHKQLARSDGPLNTLFYEIQIQKENDKGPWIFRNPEDRSEKSDIKK